MAIRKQEFYEGAALHLLARAGAITSIRYVPPVFMINGIVVLLKYCTKSRSPWGFTFMPDEQLLLHDTITRGKVIVGLICGSDGVAAFTHSDYRQIAPLRKPAIHVSCYREHGEHYAVNGPVGTLGRKIAPSTWCRILDQEVNSDETP